MLSVRQGAWVEYTCPANYVSPTGDALVVAQYKKYWGPDPVTGENVPMARWELGDLNFTCVPGKDQ